MNNREKSYRMETYLRASSGETKVIENMQKEGQAEVVYYTLLSKTMIPSKEEYEELGFVFINIEDDDVLYQATLPNGWRLEATEVPTRTSIIDENGLVRGTMFYKAAYFDRKAEMSLKNRYNVLLSYVEGPVNYMEIYFGNEEEKLFIAGQVPVSSNGGRNEAIAEGKLEEKLINQATKYAEENYPDWRNVHAYWELEKERTENQVNKSR